MPAPKEQKVQPQEKEPRRDFVLKEKTEELEETLESSIEIKFATEEEERKLAEDICEEIRLILTDRKDLEDEWDAQEDAYEGNLADKNFPFEDCSNSNVPIIAEKVDAVTARVEEGIWGVEPLWIVRPMGNTTKEVCEKKERVLDYTSRREMDLETQMDNVIHDAVCKGTGILELPWVHETERVTDVERYAGNKKGLAEFLENYPEAPENKEQSRLWHKFRNQLEKKEDIEVIVDYDEDVWNGPKPQHVPLKDFITENVKNLRKSHINGKRIWQSGDELLRKVKDNYYEQARVNRVRYNIGEKGEWIEDEDFLTKSHECFVVIYKYDVDGDGLEERILVDVAYEKKVILRAIKYPYWHKRPYFIPFYISSKADGFYRSGLAEMLEDIQVLANVLFNLVVDAGTVGVVPSFKALEGAKSYLAPQLNKGWYPGVTFWTRTPDDIEQLQINLPNLGIITNLAAMVDKYAELRSGVSHYMTGKEAPLDPRAPARKAMLLLREANMRVGKYINNLQHSMAELAYQIIELYYQFMPEGKEYQITGEEGEPAFPKISREELRQKTYYVPHGSVKVFFRALEKEINKEIFETLSVHPLIARNPEAQRYLLETYVKSAGADWDKQVHKIIPTEEKLKEYLTEIQVEAIKRKEEEDRAKGERLQQLMATGIPEAQAVRQVEDEFLKMKDEERKRKEKEAKLGRG